MIFLIPNNLFLLCPLAINLIVFFYLNIRYQTSAKKAINNLLKFLPFILLTVIINIWLDTDKNAIWIGVKLLLVCNITFLYSQTTTTTSIAKTIRKLGTPLKIFKINPEQIEVLVAISLAMLPILKREYSEIKEACKAKNIKLTIGNIKIILSKLLTSFLIRVSQIDEALVEKGYNY